MGSVSISRCFCLRPFGRVSSVSSSTRLDVPLVFVTLVFELDADYSANSIGSPDQADTTQELTYVDIDTFLASFWSSLIRVDMGTLRARSSFCVYCLVSYAHVGTSFAPHRQNSQGCCNH